MPFDPATLEYTASMITQIITIVSSVIFAALFLERRTNSKIQSIKDEVCSDLENLDKQIRNYIDSKHELSKERTKYLNDTLEKIAKQIERLENMSFTEYYKKFYPRSRRKNDDDDDDELHSK